MRYILFFDGNIGAGKSTLINKLGDELRKRDKRVLCLLEPIESWQSSGLFSLQFYNPQRWTFPFQVNVLGGRCLRDQQVVADRGWDVALVERSYFGDRAFAEVALDAEHVTTEEYDVYTTLWTACSNAVRLTDDIAAVYFRISCHPNQCMKNIHQRGRSEESYLQRAFLLALDYKTSILYTDMKVPHIVISWERGWQKTVADISTGLCEGRL